MLRAVTAGLGYFAIVFAAGFMLGTLRVLAVTPRLDEHVAVLMELPLMLAISWMACGWTVRYFSVLPAPAPRIVMGAVAFLLLMAAETGVSILAFGRTIAQHVQTYQGTASQMGLLAQIAFALFPVVRLWARR
jgi:hypothetical protein